MSAALILILIPNRISYILYVCIILYQDELIRTCATATTIGPLFFVAFLFQFLFHASRSLSVLFWLSLCFSLLFSYLGYNSMCLFSFTLSLSFQGCVWNIACDAIDAPSLCCYLIFDKSNMYSPLSLSLLPMCNIVIV